MCKTFMISDMHLGHKHIIDYEKRPFRDVEEMDKTIIENWNKTVSKEDRVFVLGDISFYNKDKTKEILNGLNGRKILILGNHDRERSLGWWRDAGITEAINYPIILEEFYILSHEPVYLSESMPYANIHGHIHRLQYNNYQYFNVSVECVNYTPVSFESIKESIIKATE